MKIVGVIPARYASTRFPGKPLAEICGKPMLWWVYQQVKKVEKLDEVYVAIDDEKIEAACKRYNLKYIYTSNQHPNHIARIWEVSEKTQADYYVCVNGDEPLIDPISIQGVLPHLKCDSFYFGGAYRKLTDPAETIDPNNIKVALSGDGEAVYMSRSPVPYPKGTILMNYNKYVGIECFNKASLDYFVSTPMAELEHIEDIDHLRFLENGKRLIFNMVNSESLAVDTKNDLEKVKLIIAGKLKTGELTNE